MERDRLLETLEEKQKEIAKLRETLDTQQEQVIKELEEKTMRANVELEKLNKEQQGENSTFLDRLIEALVS